MNTVRTIGLVPSRTTREAIAVALKETDKARVIDVRLVVPNKKNKGRETVNGLQLNPASVPAIISFLQRAHAQAIAAGWCHDGT